MILALMLACTGDTGGDGTKTSTSSSSTSATFEVSITSPEDGAVFEYGDTVDFAVERSDGGNIKTAEWTIGDMSQKGTEVSVSDLPPGDLQVKVEGVAGGADYSDTISITVNPPAPIPYSGTVAMEFTLRYNGSDYDDSCPGTINFTYDGTTLTGGGTCTETLFDTAFSFTLDGTAKSTAKIEGNLVLDYDGTQYSTPFTATGKYGEQIDATYDYTHKDSGNTLRVYGTWTASP